MQKKGWLIGAVIALILLFLVKVNTVTLVVTKFFVNSFACGRSDVKIISFLIFFLISSLIIWSNAKYNLKIKLLKGVNLKKIFWIVIGITFLVGLLSYLQFIIKYDLSFFGQYHGIYEGEMSSTQPFHIHTSKAGLAKIIEKTNPEYNYYADTGVFYAKYLHPFFWIAGLVALPLLIILGLLLIFILASENQNRKYGNFLLFISIVSLFSIIKNSFDGGILFNETLFWLPILIAVLYPGKDIKNFLKKGFLFTFAGFVLLILLYLFIKNGFSFVLMNYLSYLAFFFAIFGLFYYSRKKVMVLFVIIGYISVALLLTFFNHTYVDFTINVFDYATKDVPQGSKMYIYYPGQNECKKVYFKQEDFVICEDYVKENTTIAKLLDEHAMLQPNFIPITVVNITCNESKITTKLYDFVLVEGKVPDLIDIGIAKFTLVNSIDSKYLIQETSYTCIPQHEEFAQRVLNKHGMKASIWINEEAQWK